MGTATKVHTPGPWEFVLDDDGVTAGVTFIIRMGSHLHGKNGWQPQHRIEYGVASQTESPKQFAEAQANARLIAAAPDLLAALRICRAIIGSGSRGARIRVEPEAIAQTEAAIAKAEGR